MNDSAKCPRCGAPLASDAPEGLCPRCLAALPFGPETVLTGAGTAPSPPPLTPDEIAPHFPQLEILECLGRGGMGVVYKARQKSLDRCVALKLMAPERIGDPHFSERFAREAQALAKLTHPGIVAVHDFGEAGGFFYLLMEFVDGVNLRRALSGGHFTPEQALAMVPLICEALQFAHECGIVHRDIKPENLLLAKDGRVKIADFGIAKMLGAEAAQAKAAAEEEKAAGTPGYMAPEQKETPGRADSRADIYSLGVVFYEMLTGELPAKQIEPPSRKVRVDVRIDEIVLRALEKEPALRYQTAGEVRAAVTSVIESPDVPSLPTGVAPVPPDPWPRRILWILGLLFGLPALLIFVGLLVPYILLGNDRAAVQSLLGWLTALGIGLVWLVVTIGLLGSWRHRKKSTSATQPVASPRRPVAWAVVTMIALPVLLLLVGIALPALRRVRSVAANTAAEVSSRQDALHAELVADASRPAHTAAHMEADGVTAYAVQEPERLHFVFFHRGSFTSGSSGSSNRASMLWVDEGAIRLKNGRSFGFRRESVLPEMLWVNGQEYDLRKGTAFVLMEEGTVLPCAIFPEPVTVKTLPALAEAVERPAQAQTSQANRTGQPPPSIAASTLQLDPAPNPGSPQPPAPEGAQFTREWQVVVPQESRVALELYEQINDGDRARIGGKFVFKTAIGSGLGVLLRWRGYGPDHLTHAGQWMLDLVDPQNDVTFHRVTARYGEPMTLTPLEGAAPSPVERTPTTLEQEGSHGFARLLQAERPTLPGEAARVWSEVQAFVTFIARQQAGDPVLFQLPPSPPRRASPVAGADDGSHAHAVSADDPFVVKATGILQRLPKRDLEIGREAAVTEAAIELGKLFPEVDTIANVTEFKDLLTKRAEGAKNVSEIRYWLLGFREKVRAPSQPAAREKESKAVQPAGPE